MLVATAVLPLPSVPASTPVDADIIVNTDGDNQYSGADISRLVQPILKRRVDIMVGDREHQRVAHFSPLKKLLQSMSSWAVRRS